MMKKTILTALLALLMFLPVSLMAQEVDAIDVAPNVLNIGSKGTVVTVHTNIKYSVAIVDGSEVISCTLNDVHMIFCFADNRGYFVAKFNIDDIKDLPNLDYDELNALILTITDVGGTETFKATQGIKVINVVPKKK